jgi:hypothetical protein
MTADPKYGKHVWRRPCPRGIFGCKCIATPPYLGKLALEYMMIEARLDPNWAYTIVALSSYMEDDE